MSVKAVEMVRKIRDQIYEETKDLSIDEQLKYYKKKSDKLERELAKWNKRKSKPTAPAARVRGKKTASKLLIEDRN